MKIIHISEKENNESENENGINNKKMKIEK